MITFQRILFPTDFSGQSAAVVPAVKAMAKRFDSEVVVLHVIDLPLAWYGASEAADIVAAGLDSISLFPRQGS